VSPPAVAIIGPGRVGLSLARALARSGSAPRVLARHERVLPDPLGDATVDWDAAIAAAGLVVIAVPDDMIPVVSAGLAERGIITRRHVVLHTSGLHGRSALAALAPGGAGLGSWHPVQTFTDRDGDPLALSGAPVVIEGDDRALAAGRDLAARLGLAPVLVITGEQKAKYHAAAVFASNYIVVLSRIATRLGREAGLGPDADTIFLPLVRRTAENLVHQADGALTGPIARGDAGTVARHVASLEGPTRTLYQLMGREALSIARAAGLDDRAAAAIDAALK